MRASVALFVVMFSLYACDPAIPVGEHYYGELPCNDCEPIRFELEFLGQSRYRSSSLLSASGEVAAMDSGEVEFINDTLIALRSVEGNTVYFALGTDELLLSDEDGGVRVSSESRLGVLKRVDSHWKPERASVSKPAFKATGNEPFWSLELFPEKEFIFRSSEGSDHELHAKWVDPVRQTDLNAITFECQTTHGPMIINIVRQDCTDSMSGQKSQYGVGISLGEDIADPEHHYTGCGEWLGVYGITGNWSLQQLDGKDIILNTEDPIQLSFHPIERSIGGFLGCNRMFGEMQLIGDSLRTGVLASTRMMCPEHMELEQEILNGLTESAFRIQLTDSILTLSNSSHQFMLRKMN